MTFSEAHARIAQLLAESPWRGNGWTFFAASHNGDLCGGCDHCVEYWLHVDDAFSTIYHPTPDAVVEQLEDAITGRTKPIDLSSVDVERVTVSTET